MLGMPPHFPVRPPSPFWRLLDLSQDLEGDWDLALAHRRPPRAQTNQVKSWTPAEKRSLESPFTHGEAGIVGSDLPAPLAL